MRFPSNRQCQGIPSPLLLVCAFLLWGGARAAWCQSSARVVRLRVGQLVAAFAQGSQAKVDAFWEPDGQGRATFNALREYLRKAQPQLSAEKTRFLRLTVQGQEATVRVAFDLRGRDPASGAEGVEENSWDLKLHFAAGGWKVKSWTDAVHDAVVALTGARDDPARRAILRREQDLASLLKTRLPGFILDAEARGEAEEVRALRAAGAVLAAAPQKPSDGLPPEMLLGARAFQEGRYEEAIQYDTAAVEFFAHAGKKDLQAAVLQDVGASYRRLGKPDRAVHFLQQCLQLTQEPMIRASAYTNLGAAYEALSEYGLGLAALETGLKEARKLPDREFEADAWNNLGLLYFRMRQPVYALLDFVRAGNIYAGLSLVEKVAEVHDNIAGLEVSEGHLEGAERAYKRVLELAEMAGNPPWLIGTRANRLGLLRALGRTAELRTECDSLRRELPKLEDSRSRAIVLTNLGQCYEELGEYSLALELLREAAPLAEGSGSLDLAAGIHAHLGEALRHLNRWSEARQAYQHAAQLTEVLRGEISDPILQISTLDSHSLPYLGLVECVAHEAGAGALPAEEMLRLSEQAKARSLVQLLSGRALRPASPAARKREWELTAELTALTIRQSAAKTEAEKSALTAQWARKDLEYQEFLRRQAATDSGLARRRPALPPPTLSRLQSELLHRFPRLRLLSYVVGEESSYLLEVSRGEGGRVQSQAYPLRNEAGRPFTSAELTKHTTALEEGCATEYGIYQNEARLLYQWLLQPVDAHLAPGEQVVIIPDGALSHVPFQALLDGGNRFLVERTNVSYAPSLTSLLQMLKLSDQRQTGGARPLLAVGLDSFTDYPPLTRFPLLGMEAAAGEAARGGKGVALVGLQATKAKVVAALPSAGGVLLATHAVLNPVVPLQSYVVLHRGGGKDALLRAEELLGMKLNAKLVVLAACDTARGGIYRGEGVLGLTWALFAAGVPATVVTQWSVRSDTTTGMVRQFYQGLQAPQPPGKTRPTRAALLCEVQRQALKMNRQPFFWAPLVLVGDWR